MPNIISINEIKIVIPPLGGISGKDREGPGSRPGSRPDRKGT